ncbi:MAG: VOC family protein [Phycisphaerales bacterium]
MIRYTHTNIVAKDWRRLARFYVEVFDCELLMPERDLAEPWVAAASGVPDAHLRGAHLRLPGYDALDANEAPTLEIYEYDESPRRPKPVAANRPGFGHIAFAVDDVPAALRRLLDHGGGRLGELVTATVPGKGDITWVYATDPEGNIIELQRWHDD